MNSIVYYNSFIPDNSLLDDILEDKFNSNNLLDSNDKEDSFIHSFIKFISIRIIYII